MKSNKSWSIKTHRLVAAVGLGTFFLANQSGWAFTKSGKTITTDGSFADVKSAVSYAMAGDVVQVPAGNFVWGHANDQLYISTAITLQGAGPSSTFITLPDDSKAYYSGAVVVIQAAATVQGFAMAESATCPATGFCAQGANGWRITDITYVNGGGAYFVYAGSYGLIDHCVIYGSSGSAELVFARGPTDSWQTPNSMGTSNAVVIENCAFSGAGYVCDANSNARMVVRFCTITGAGIKIDGHGKASNTPARGVRQLEAYGNEWTAMGEGGAWDSLEIRGGTGMFFNNVVYDNTYALRGLIQLKEYGSLAQWPNFGSVFQTLYDYPVDDQIGVGQDPKKAGSEPVYLWNNLKAGVPQVLNWVTIPTAAIEQYARQTGKSDATFTMQDIVKADRDFFCQVDSFDGSSGIGIGTKAQMKAITPAKTNVGFWVTDEGNWNMTVPTNHSGQLYCWNGSAWVLKYVPLVYPFGATTNFYVPPQPGPPKVNPDLVVAYKNTPATYCPLTNDAVVSPGGYLSIVSIAVTNGTAKTDGTNITFQGNAGFMGTAYLGYTVSDNVGYSNTAVDVITVTNLPPGAGSPDNPILWYKFNGNLLDSSPHENDGTNVGALVFTKGTDAIANHAFHSSQGSLVCSPAFAQPPGVNWSVALWFKADNTNGVYLISCFSAGYGSTQTDKALMLWNGVLTGYVFANGSKYLSSPNITSTNVWKQAVFGQDSSGNTFLYEDGVLVASQPNVASLSQYTTYFLIGGEGYLCEAKDFIGAIDDVRLYNNYRMTDIDADRFYKLGILTPPQGLRVSPNY